MLPYCLWIKSTYLSKHRRPHWYRACPLSCLILHHCTHWPAGQAPVLWAISESAVIKVGRLLTPHLSLLMSHPLYWHAASPPLRFCSCQVLPHSQGMHLVFLLMPMLPASLLASPHHTETTCHVSITLPGVSILCTSLGQCQGQRDIIKHMSTFSLLNAKVHKNKHSDPFVFVSHKKTRNC